MEVNMEQLPFELKFMHKFNIHKQSGLLIDDYDLVSMARVYGVKPKELKKLEIQFDKRIKTASEKLREKFGVKPVKTAYTIAAIGDSLTSDRESYVKILNHLWKEDGGRVMIDCGISGDTTCDVVNRFYQTVMNQEFSWAVIFLGTNDSRANDDEYNHSFLSVDEYKRNMIYIIENLLKRQKKIILVTIPDPDNSRMKAYFTEFNVKYDMKRIGRTNDVIRELSKKYGTELADFSVRLKEYGLDGLEKDGIHITIEAHMVLCELLLGILP
jgi:lysophospholipase L1-like esterase